VKVMHDEICGTAMSPFVNYNISGITSSDVLRYRTDIESLNFKLCHEIWSQLITLHAKLSSTVCCNRSYLFVSGFVCLWVCYHDNSKLRASIFTKLGLYVKVVTISSFYRQRAVMCLSERFFHHSGVITAKNCFCVLVLSEIQF